MDLITQENLSKELLKSILDAAFMDTSYDKDGDIKVAEGINCFVLPNMDRKDRILLLAVFRLLPGTPELLRLQAANRINRQFVIVRATVEENDLMRFTWDLPLAGGLTPKAFVLAVKRFCTIPREAIADCAGDVVA